jgi:hypothetical protein
MCETSLERFAGRVFGRSGEGEKKEACHCVTRLLKTPTPRWSSPVGRTSTLRRATVRYCTLGGKRASWLCTRCSRLITTTPSLYRPPSAVHTRCTTLSSAHVFPYNYNTPMSRTTVNTSAVAGTAANGLLRKLSIKTTTKPPQFWNPLPPSDVKLFVTNLRLINLDLRPDWPGITVQTFSSRNADQKQRIGGVEWALFRLFEIWDPAETSQVGNIDTDNMVR